MVGLLILLREGLARAQQRRSGAERLVAETGLSMARKPEWKSVPVGSSTLERALLEGEQGCLNGTATDISLERDLLELESKQRYP
jgi:hypothetical protein